MIRLETLRVAAIVDEFTEYGLSKECVLLNLSYMNWKRQIEEFRPELLFVESAWRGFHNQWIGQLTLDCSEIKEIIQWCRNHGVVTVFWNKEDPVHFFHFFSCASLFDWVFTTDLESIPMYMRLLGHNQVGLFPFAISNKVYHPIETTKRKNEVCFAGTYYRARTKRCQSFARIYECISRSMKLSIYNRNSHPENIDYQFPQEYQSMILGTLPVERMDEAYKGYRFGLTMNTVVTSSTMLARRVFELMASNTVVISNECKAISTIFGELVLQEQDPNLVEKLRQLSMDDFHYRKIRLLALRKVLMEHTYHNRLTYLISKVLKETVKETSYSVCIVSVVKNQEEANRVCASYQRQSYEKTRCVLITEDEIHVPSEIETIKRCSLEQLDSISNCDFFAYFSSDHYYGMNYIRDFVLALSYSEVSIIGKGSYYQCNNNEMIWKEEVSEYSYGSGICMDRCMISRKDAANIMIEYLEQTDGKYCLAKNYLSTDGFHFCEGFHEVYCEYVEDIKITTGLSIQQLYEQAEKKMESESRFEVTIEAEELLQNLYFGNLPITRSVVNGYLQIGNQKVTKTRYYLTDPRIHAMSIFKDTRKMRVLFSCKCQNARLMLTCMDCSQNILKTYLILANQFTTINIPSSASFFFYRIVVENVYLIEIKGIYINPILSYV